MAVIHCTEEEFEDLLKAGLPTVVAFLNRAPACADQGVVLRTVSESYDGEVRVLLVNADEAKGLVERFGVSGVPTYIALQKGLEVDRRVAAQTAPQLDDWVGAKLEFG